MLTFCSPLAFGAVHGLWIGTWSAANDVRVTALRVRFTFPPSFPSFPGTGGPEEKKGKNILARERAQGGREREKRREEGWEEGANLVGMDCIIRHVDWARGKGERDWTSKQSVRAKKERKGRLGGR